jgi:hypothetical protein
MAVAQADVSVRGVARRILPTRPTLRAVVERDGKGFRVQSLMLEGTDGGWFWMGAPNEPTWLDPQDRMEERLERYRADHRLELPSLGGPFVEVLYRKDDIVVMTTDRVWMLSRSGARLLDEPFTGPWRPRADGAYVRIVDQDGATCRDKAWGGTFLIRCGALVVLDNGGSLMILDANRRATKLPIPDVPGSRGLAAGRVTVFIEPFVR